MLPYCLRFSLPKIRLWSLAFFGLCTIFAGRIGTPVAFLCCSFVLSGFSLPLYLPPASLPLDPLFRFSFTPRFLFSHVDLAFLFSVIPLPLRLLSKPSCSPSHGAFILFQVLSDSPSFYRFDDFFRPFFPRLIDSVNFLLSPVCRLGRCSSAMGTTMMRLFISSA